jgi:DNA-binding transcriptional LysR family regulator
MDRDNAGDLLAFLAVARDRSFTRAAAKLGISQPTLSETVRRLEERLGVRLLNRTTRSVTPTQAGERLFQKIGPKFDEMDVELAALGELREKPAGTIRITATEFAAEAILLPALAKVLPLYPDINVEVLIDYGLADIVAAQYDAGIRPGELVAKDMIAVRVGPDLRMAVVGAPSYFGSRKRPRTPQDLTQHNCPGIGDTFGADRANTRHLAQAIRLCLDRVKHLLAESSNKLFCADRADARDHAGAQVFLDTVDRRWRGGAHDARLELLAMCMVVDPFAGCGDPLTSGNGRGVPNDRYQIAVPSCLDPENTKPIIVIMEGNALNETGKNFLA